MTAPRPTTAPIPPSPDFATPVDDRYYEDYVPGATYTFGRITLSEEEIVGFARRFDPQSFHTEPEAAGHGPFKGLIASGWHTTAVMMRLYADHFVSGVASLGSPGVDELRWVRPVRPGDALAIRTTILDARVSRSKPDRGLVHTRIEVLNQRDEPVLTVTAVNLFRRRPDAAA
ncbi:MaoC family dehydratase [Streptomyces sp. B-S-A8]|uniref:MaoC family dehydratase n=1 Tax=Streptomyces solicavernae TaxID=3043614 RepID=A0ABT6RMG3_9ACTN|nr:MaoC family dehydratase [Streptomyces sp. B-S-A8]MDI3384938.1 MaoC family dehydratase [Streptomyces sp. B-S-A8]